MNAAELKTRFTGYVFDEIDLDVKAESLVGFATAVSTHTVYRWLWRAIFILIPTLLLGRVFCGWICPMGTIQQFVGWLFNIRRNRHNIDANRYRSVFQLKYFILALFLVLREAGKAAIGAKGPALGGGGAGRGMLPRPGA